METLLNNRNTYLIVTRDPIKKITKDLRSLLLRWKKHDYMYICDEIKDIVPERWSATKSIRSPQDSQK